jgi:hypothetical protein
MSRRTTFPSPWREMAERAGGVALLAKSLGIAVSTLRSWATGTRTPGATVQASVIKWAARRGLSAPSWQKGSGT